MVILAYSSSRSDIKGSFLEGLSVFHCMSFSHVSHLYCALFAITSQTIAGDWVLFKDKCLE